MRLVKNISQRHAMKGFTLVEMAVVLVIVGLLIATFSITLTARMDYENYKSTTETLEQVKKALIGYAMLNNSLPCPASNSATGIEDTTLCNVEGYLPWANLGIGKYDAWGKYLRYRIDSAYTSTYSFNPPFQNPSDNLAVQEYVTAINLVSPSKIATVIFSLGKNRTADEDNADGDITFTQSDYPTDSFDDILIWITENELASSLAAAGKKIK